MSGYDWFAPVYNQWAAADMTEVAPESPVLRAARDDGAAGLCPARAASVRGAR